MAKIAKATKANKKFEFSKIGTILDNIAKSVPITIEKEIKKEVYNNRSLYSRCGNVR